MTNWRNSLATTKTRNSWGRYVVA